MEKKINRMRLKSSNNEKGKFQHPDNIPVHSELYFLLQKNEQTSPNNQTNKTVVSIPNEFLPSMNTENDSKKPNLVFL